MTSLLLRAMRVGALFFLIISAAIVLSLLTIGM